MNTVACGPIAKAPDYPGMIQLIKERAMNRLLRVVILTKIWRDERGQDLIEYALMAGFVAVAAGAIMPNIASSISTIFSQIGSVLTAAASQS
jgi:pilus assembly protein Flp/PilA